MTYSKVTRSVYLLFIFFIIIIHLGVFFVVFIDFLERELKKKKQRLLTWFSFEIQKNKIEKQSFIFIFCHKMNKIIRQQKWEKQTKKHLLFCF